MQELTDLKAQILEKSDAVPSKLKQAEGWGQTLLLGLNPRLSVLRLHHYSISLYKSRICCRM